jgi:hypothetical protein
MDLNLRGVDDALVGKLKRGAFEQGKTLKEYCVEALTALAEGKAEAPEKAARTIKVKLVERDPVAVVLELAASGVEEFEEPKAISQVCRACKRPMEKYQDGIACFNSGCPRNHIVMGS